MSSLPPPQASGRPAWLMPVLAGCGCVVVAGIVAIIAVVVLGVRIMEESESVGVSLQLPQDAAVGSPMTWTLTVTNLGQEDDVRVTDVNVPAELLTALRTQSVEPAPLRTSEIFGSISHEYDLSVAPGQAVTLTWTCIPAQPGRFTGEIDVHGPFSVATTRFDVTISGSAPQSP